MGSIPWAHALFTTDAAADGCVGNLEISSHSARLAGLALSLSLSCTHAHSTENEPTIVEKTWNVIRFSVTRFALLLNLLYIYFINTHNFLHSVAQWNFTSSRANLFACICTFHYTALLYVCMYEYAYIFVCVYICIQFVVAARSAVAIFFLFLLNKQLRCPKRR